MLKKNLKKFDGFSLLELLLSIAIIGLIILMATRYFTTVKAGQQGTAAVQQVTAIRAAVNAQSAQGATVSLTSVCNVLPAGSCNGTTGFNFAWDGTSGTSTLDVSALPAYKLDIQKIPTASACQTILSAFASSITNTTVTCPSTYPGALELDFTTAN